MIVLLGVAACVVLVLVVTWTSVPVVVFAARGRQRLLSCVLSEIGKKAGNARWSDLDPLIAGKLRRLLDKHARTKESAAGTGLARLLIVMQGVDRRPPNEQVEATARAMDDRITDYTHRLQTLMLQDDLTRIVISASGRIRRMRISLAIQNLRRYGLGSGRYAMNEIARDASALAALSIIVCIPVIAAASLIQLKPVDAWIWLANAASGGTLAGICLGVVELTRSTAFLMKSGSLSSIERDAIRTLVGAALGALLVLITTVVAAAFRLEIARSLSVPSSGSALSPTPADFATPLSPLIVIVLIALFVAVWLGMGRLLRGAFKKRSTMDPVKQVGLWTALIFWLDFPVIVIGAAGGGFEPSAGTVARWMTIVSSVVLLLLPEALVIAAVAVTFISWFASRRRGRRPRYLTNMQVGLVWALLYFVAIGPTIFFGTIMAAGFITNFKGSFKVVGPWLIAAQATSIVISILGFRGHRAKNARLRTNQQLDLVAHEPHDQPDQSLGVGVPSTGDRTSMVSEFGAVGPPRSD